MSKFNPVVFDKIVKRASDFVTFNDNIEIEMLKTAITVTNIDMDKLCVFNDQQFKYDITGLMSNFDFETMTCDTFLPLSSKNLETLEEILNRKRGQPIKE
ncbi:MULTISPECIES: hypothetical protein [unclassified Gilliamella]|uniref:hypothetical protein n=1 Tax=unclassified Gilliamella TaxID=2685620 RepID=UPI0022699307|nr:MULTISPECIES: hypothetical protein [unclassified Gilliamella]MCX8589125.1 hypothetical protein [Gilliamella sp. B3801]MCX8592604.1 hypothetical protein [Gilliamella sp. B3804]